MGMFTEIHQDTDGRSAGMPEALGQAASGGGRMWVRVVEEEEGEEHLPHPKEKVAQVAR